MRTPSRIWGIRRRTREYKETIVLIKCKPTVPTYNHESKKFACFALDFPYFHWTSSFHLRDSPRRWISWTSSRWMRHNHRASTSELHTYGEMKPESNTVFPNRLTFFSNSYFFQPIGKFSLFERRHRNLERFFTLIGWDRIPGTYRHHHERFALFWCYPLTNCLFKIPNFKLKAVISIRHCSTISSCRPPLEIYHVSICFL